MLVRLLGMLGVIGPQSIGNRPLLLFGILLIFTGVQLVTVGLVGDNWLARGSRMMPDGAADPEASIIVLADFSAWEAHFGVGIARDHASSHRRSVVLRQQHGNLLRSCVLGR
mgnify:CR=1 FL=1